MACSSCGKASQVQQSPAMLQQAAAPNPEYVRVIYRGTIGNHFVPSPNRLVKHYGYRSHGDEIDVHPSDVRHSPNLFFPGSLDVAMKVWAEYPNGAPAEVVLAFGVPQQALVNDDPPLMPKALEPKAPAVKKKIADKKVRKQTH